MAYAHSNAQTTNAESGDAPYKRAKRHQLMLRCAKLVCARGEFVCILRDVSEGGVGTRIFHRLPNEPRFTLELQNGFSAPMTCAWQRDERAGFAFNEEIEISAFLHEKSDSSQPGLKFNLNLPGIITDDARENEHEIEVHHISQEGIGFASPERFAIRQRVFLRMKEWGLLAAKITTRRGGNYEAAFENSFSLRDFANLTARSQCPELSDSQGS